MNIDFIGAWLFDTLLTTTLLMAAILIVRRPVAKYFGPTIAYALWLIPAARLCMPSIEGPSISTADDGIAIQDAVRDAVLAGLSSPDTLTTAANPVHALPTIDFVALGLMIWLGGAVLLFIVQMIRYAAMRDDLLAEATDVAVVDGVKIVASDQVAGPLAFGLFHRVIAVPQDFTKAYSPAERDLAIAHEMAHHKSGDLFANLAAFTILCLQWFNPVAWISWNAFRFDQEAACDARVLAGKGAEERAIYGQALAKTAFDGVPAFATALNSPKTIIERLRRITMKDTSTTRRSLGKIGIITAAAIILPLTATIVPAVAAQDKVAAEEGKPEVVKRSVRIIKLKRDGETIDIAGQDDLGGEVTKIERDGKTFIFSTDKKLSQEEVEQLIEKAEKSREEAEGAVAQAGEAGQAQGKADSAKGAEVHMRAPAKIRRVETIRVVDDINVASYIPDLDIREITKDCRNGEQVTTDVSGFDGKHKSHVRLVMCGKGQAKLARIEAIKGLREARNEIENDKEMPKDVRKDVVKQIDLQIRKLEAQGDAAE
jgi:beta-lactamase regulating signal transducer with metallopeptidase domain